MDLDRAKLNCDFPEFALVLMWQSWSCYTDIDYDALEYLVKHSSRILLPNVKSLSEEKRSILTNFKGNRRSNSEISNFIIDYYSNLLKDLQDNIQYDINYIYTNHILPIAKNSDIHALSLFIYDIFFGINFKNIMASNFIGQNTTNLVNNLLEDALYNRINGPVHLSNKLDEIINSIY